MARKAEVIYVGDAASIVRASAEAKAAIKSVQDQASKKSALDKLPQLGGNISTAMLAAAPAVAGLAGALGGLAASATAAAGGAGAVAVGGVGALAVGLGSIAAVAKPAAANFTKVTTALDAFNTTMAKNAQVTAAAHQVIDTYGAKSKKGAAAVATLTAASKQATAAQQALNAVVGQNGGARVLAAAKSWDALGKSFQKMTGPATSAMFRTFNDVIATIKDVLPTVAGIANRSMKSFGEALQGPLSILRSGEFQGILKSLGNTFAQSIGPAVQAASLVFLGFSRIAQAAGPYVVQLSLGIETLASKFALATADPKRLSGIISGLVSQTKSWIALGGALGKLIFDVFKQGAKSGQGMVDSLTGVLKKWDAWATSVGGSQKITQFFQNSAKFVKELAGALGPVVKAFSVMSTGPLPIYISLMSKLKGIMGPLTYAFVAYKVALLGATAATKAAEAVGAVRNLFGGAAAGAAGGAAGTAAKTAAGASAVETAAAGAGGVGAASVGLGPIAIGAAAAYLGISKLSQAINGDNGLSAGLKKMQSQMQSAIAAGNTSKLQQLAAAAQGFGAKLANLGVNGASAYKTLGAEAKNAADKMTASFGAMSHTLNSVSPIFHTMANDAGLSLNRILTQAKSSASAIASTLGTRSTDARVALANNFNIAAQDVRASMQAGVVNTGQGMKAIATLISKALSALGGKPLAVSNFLADVGPGAVTAQQLVSAGAISQGGANSPHASGGLVQIGKAGDAGHDSVPINAMVAPGEQVAVFNRHQLPIVNRALGGIGGLKGLFSKVRTPHYMASGGTLNYGQLEGLWGSGGGPKSVASLAAAIALAESGGRDVMQQGQPFATTGWGYWQITPGGPQYLDPMTNARAAVAKYHGAGNTFRPWTTFNDGAYRQFLHGGVPAIGGGFGASSIKAPKVSGAGLMSALVRAGVGKVAKAANAFLGRQQPQGGSFVGGGGASSGPGGLAVFEGVTMAKWIANELQWATQHGWHGQPTSGYRPGFDPHAPGGSEHALIDYPGGAVDFGGFTDPHAYATKLALVELAQRLNYPGPRLKMPIGFHDDGHLSGTGHARGGLLPFVGSFKNGGIVPRTGMAFLHGGERVSRFASGGLVQTGAAGGPSGLPSAPLVPVGPFIYKTDAALAALATELQFLQGAAHGSAAQIKGVKDQMAELTQFKAFHDAIAGLKDAVKNLASQAAQSWNTLQQIAINKTHDTAIAAINNGPLAKQLAAMQADDAAAQNRAQLDQLNQAVSSAQYLVDHSGGQTHINALSQLQQAQDALTAYQRQQDEQRLQDQITAATTAADQTQQTALAGLDQQTTDYQNSLDAQLAALTDNLAKRKLNYAQWAADVNRILAAYGLSVATDPTTEGTVDAGPDTDPTRPTKKPKRTIGWGFSSPSGWGGHRASGGPVAAGVAYTVGERGPETFVSGSSGHIVPHGGARVVIQKATFTGARSARAFADRLSYRAAIGVA